MEKIRINEANVESIFVMDDADAPVVGLVQANFTIDLSLNGAASAVAVTITEVDAVNNPGEYSVSFTPNAEGVWILRIRHATYEPMGWRGLFEAVQFDPDEGVSGADFQPRITNVLATSSLVTVEFVGWRTQRYRVRLLDSGFAVEDEQFRTGGGRRTLTPTSAGEKTVQVVGVSDADAVQTAAVSVTVTVPS